MSNSREQVESNTKRVLKYVSVHGTVALCGISIFFGYLLGWYMQAHPDKTGISFILGIVLMLLLRGPVKIWTAWLEQKPDQEIIDAIMLDLEPEEVEEPKVKKPKKTDFSQDDFDDAGKALLLKMVKQARKAGSKVTGQGLYETVLKSIR